MKPGFETVVVDYNVTTDSWDLISTEGREELGPDTALGGILSALGQQGFCVVSSGGVNESGFGPTRLILSRLVANPGLQSDSETEPETAEDEKPRPRWLGDDEDDDSPPPLPGG